MSLVGVVEATCELSFQVQKARFKMEGEKSKSFLIACAMQTFGEFCK